MDEFVKTFHIDWKLMIAQLINFGIVFAIFYFLASKPLGKLIKERTQEIETGLSDAEKNAKILKATQAEYDEAIGKAKVEANNIFQTGKKEAETKKTEMLEEAKTEVAGIISNGKKMLEAEKVKMVEDAKKEVANLAILAMEKLLTDKGETYTAQSVKAVKGLNNSL
ncbi:MAG: F0F1 ATP synthase subunit B [Candidatus Paceibacterota bacterium]